MTRYRYTVTREYVGVIEADRNEDGDFEDDEDFRDYVEDLAIDDVTGGLHRDATTTDVDLQVIE